MDGFYYKPRVDMEVLKTYHKGIIALSACLAGEVPRFLARGLYEEAKEAVLKIPGDLWTGKLFPGAPGSRDPHAAPGEPGIIRLSRELDIPLAATNDCHYINAEDWEAHDILLCIQTGKRWPNETGCGMRAASIM